MPQQAGGPPGNTADQCCRFRQWLRGGAAGGRYGRAICSIAHDRSPPARLPGRGCCGACGSRTALREETATAGRAAAPGRREQNSVPEVRIAGRVGKTGQQRLRRHASYFMECRPIMLPSVSTISAMKPCSPMENFSLTTCPPSLFTRATSTAQSSQEK